MGLYHECWLLGDIEKNKKGKYNKPSSQISLYSKNRAKKGDGDSNGVLTEQGIKYCQTYIRGKYSDFVNEKSEISQMETTKNTYKVMFLPKYHCELAEEGIKYARGLINKRRSRGLPLKNQNKVDTFRVSMRAALRHMSTVITK